MKARRWECLQLVDAVREDVPAEDFLVDVGEEDAAGELGEVGVLLDEGLGVEDDGVLEVLFGDLVADGAAEFALDLGVGDAEVEADGGEGDALAEVGAVPEGGDAVVGGDGDHELLGRDPRRWSSSSLAEAGALGAVEDVVGRRP